jgi:hypothetical protein
MRELPQKEDSEEEPGISPDTLGCGRPTDKGRHGTTAPSTVQSGVIFFSGV